MNEKVNLTRSRSPPATPPTASRTCWTGKPWRYPPPCATSTETYLGSEDIPIERYFPGVLRT